MDMGAPLQIAIVIVGAIMVAGWLVLAWLRRTQTDVGVPQDDAGQNATDPQTLIPPTQTADGWMEIWGIGDERAWFEHQLELTPGQYRLERTAERVERSDFRGETHDFSLERLFDGLTPRIWTIGITEVSNGVYAVIYKPYDLSTDQQEAKTS